MAFNQMHTLYYRATWAVFPYSLVVLCWYGLAQRAQQIFKGDKSEVINVQHVKKCTVCCIYVSAHLLFACFQYGSREGDSSTAIVRSGYRTATVAVIEADVDPCRPGLDEGTLQLAPGGVSLTGTKQSSIEVLPGPEGGGGEGAGGGVGELSRQGSGEGEARR